MSSWIRRHPVLAALATIVAGLCVLVWLAYRSWFAAGPWQAMPSIPAPVFSHVSDARFVGAAETAVAALSEHRRTHGFPGITIAVAVKGKLIWSGGAGWQSFDPERAVSVDTQLRIGSTSKAVTATAAARLVDQGEIALDTPIETYLKPLPNPEWRGMTLRHLFSHTSGLPGYDGNTDVEGAFLTLCGCRHYDSVRASLEIFDGSDLLFAPGSDFHYSSFDTNLIGAVLAAVQQRSYREVLQEQVFRPLGLEASGLDNDGTPRPELATFYEVADGQAGQWPDFDLSQRWPGGGLVSTSADLALIGQAWLNPGFISIETREAMWTPQRLANGEVNEQSYALGWRFNRQRESNGRVLSYAHHGGVSKGAQSWLVVYPEFGTSIALNINTRTDVFGDFARIEPTIREIFFSVLEKVEPAGASGG